MGQRDRGTPALGEGEGGKERQGDGTGKKNSGKELRKKTEFKIKLN